MRHLISLLKSEKRPPRVLGIIRLWKALFISGESIVRMISVPFSVLKVIFSKCKVL